jgi:hypothetical protein
MCKFPSVRGVFWAALFAATSALAFQAQLKPAVSAAAVKARVKAATAVLAERWSSEPLVGPYDSPIAIEWLPLSPSDKAQKKKGRSVSTRYNVRNLTGRPIRAYTLLVTNKGETLLRSTIFWGSINRDLMRPGMQELDDPQFSVWTVDWVLFEDGTSWGPDEMGQAAGIRSFIRGFDTAREQAFALARSEEAEAVRLVVDNGGYIPRSLRIPNDLPPDYGNDRFDWGYKFVAGILEYDRQRRPAALRVGTLLKEMFDAGIRE